MHIKQAVHLLTQQNHRLAWRTDQALGFLEQWRQSRITTEVFHKSIDDLLIIDSDELTADEIADWELYVQTVAAVRAQPR